jgi:small basic protein
MNDFIQMDIFFFISSVIAILFLFFVTVIGIYVFLIIKKIYYISEQFKKLSEYLTSKTSQTADTILGKINSMLQGAGPVEKFMATFVGTIIAQSLKFRGKIKKDARKNKKEN